MVPTSGNIFGLDCIMSNVSANVGSGSATIPENRDTADRKNTKPKNKRRKWDAKKRKYDKTEQDQKPKDSRLPNYFFAVKIDEPKIRGAMQAVQDHIVCQNELLEHVVVSNKLAHLTAGLLHLPNEDSVARAVSMMEGCRERLLDIVSNESFTLQIKGLGHFNERVVFAKVRPDENENLLGIMAEFLSQEFSAFKSSSPFKYTPHLTLMKLSKIQRNYNLRKKIRRIDKALFEHIMDINFGCQRVTTLQLLRMTRKEKDGYYFCVHEIPFGTGHGTAVQSTAEEYAGYLSSHILASATCMNRKKEFSEVSKDHSKFKISSIGDIAETTVDSAMNRALEEVLAKKSEPSEK